MCNPVVVETQEIMTAYRRSISFLIAFAIVMVIISYKKIGNLKTDGSKSLRKWQLTNQENQLTNQENQQRYNKSRFSEALQQPITQSQSMVLSLDYWEQTGNALRNLFDLQCWASSVNITKVVEPYIHSAGSTVFNFLGKKNQSFQDLFNITHWNQVSSKLNHSILVSKKNFLKHASKNVIFVQLLYTKHKCKSSAELEHNDWFQLLEGNGFNIRPVCIEILKSPIANVAFRNKIFDVFKDASDLSVTIIFEQWRGLSTSNKARLELGGSRCMKKCPSDLIAREQISTHPPNIKYSPCPLSPFAPLVPSKLVLGYVDTFVSHYMHGTEYVAVMLRSEKLNPSIAFSSPKHSFCMDGIMSDHNKALDHINGTKTLLFTDTGDHGSLALSWKVVPKNFSQYLQDHLELELTLKELDSALEDITRSKNSVLMALLQSNLVARATCVVIVGGGTFQALTMSMYTNSHKGHECYFLRNSKCTPRHISSKTN